jgi:uncharacterized protein (DUF1684 family)
MKKAYLSLIFLTFAWILSAQTYEDSILKSREKNLSEILDSSKSILTVDELKSFKGLDYFPLNKDFIIEATFKKDIGKKFKMATSTDRTPLYRRFGYMYFTIDTIQYQLTVYQNIALIKDKELKNYLFIPFKDLTSAKTTYGGGRYIDFNIPSTATVKIDFNTAYNPYCAYSHRFSCPIPPKENSLPIAIESGEKYVSEIFE